MHLELFLTTGSQKFHKQMDLALQFYNTDMDSSISHRMTNIICVIQGTVQTGSENKLSLAIDYNIYFFLNKVLWGGSDLDSLLEIRVCYASSGFLTPHLQFFFL